MSAARFNWSGAAWTVLLAVLGLCIHGLDAQGMLGRMESVALIAASVCVAAFCLCLSRRGRAGDADGDKSLG